MVSKLNTSHIASVPAVMGQKSPGKSGAVSSAQTVLSMSESPIESPAVVDRDIKPVKSSWTGAIADRISGAFSWAGSTAYTTGSAIVGTSKQVVSSAVNVVDTSLGTEKGYLNRTGQVIFTSAATESGYLHRAGKAVCSSATTENGYLYRSGQVIHSSATTENGYINRARNTLLPSEVTKGKEPEPTWRKVQASVVKEDGWLRWVGKKAKSFAECFPKTLKYTVDATDRGLFQGRRNEQQAQMVRLRKEVGEDSAQFCETLGEWTKAYIPNLVHGKDPIFSSDGSSLDEQTVKMAIGVAHDSGLIERTVDYEHALLNGFSNGKKVLDDFTPDQVTKLLADTTAGFVKDDKALQKGFRKRRFSSEDAKKIAIFREYEKKGKLPKGFPKTKVLTEANLDDELDKALKLYLHDFCNGLLKVLLPKEEKGVGIWEAPLLEKIGKLDWCLSNGYTAAKDNILIPILQNLLGGLVVDQFTKKHDCNLMMMKIIGLDVTDLEMHGFGLGKTDNVERVAEKMMAEFVRDGSSNEVIDKILKESKLEKVSEQGPRAALRTKEEANKRLKAQIVHILRKNMYGVSTKKCKAKRTWFTPIKEAYKAFRHKIRALPIIGWVYRGIENTYHTIKFGLSYFMCLLLGKDKPAIGDWAKKTLSGSRLAESIADNSMETLHNPANRVLFLRLLEDLKNELVSRSEEIHEQEKLGLKGKNRSGTLPVKPIARYDFSASAEPIGRIADHYFPRIFPRFVAKPIQKVTRFLNKVFRWKKANLKTIAGNAVVDKLNDTIESSTFDLIGRSLQMAQPCLDESRIGMKLAAAFKKRGVDHPNLDQVIANKLCMFVEGYVSNIGEELYLKELCQKGYDPLHHNFETVKKCGFEDLMSYEDYMNSAAVLRNQGEALFLVALKDQGFSPQDKDFKLVKKLGFGTIRPSGSKSAYESFMEVRAYKGTYYETYRREVLNKLLALSDDPKEMMARILEGPQRNNKL
ncbi:MAG: hypothetical protein ACI9S8_001020 [Chlamydiales bacterium]